MIKQGARDGELQYDNEFWRFSLAVYKPPDVAAECLALQEAVGLDVNLYLARDAWNRFKPQRYRGRIARRCPLA